MAQAAQKDPKQEASRSERPNGTEKKSFNADVSRLLDIVANALYTNHDVFLRELISNAADACDKLRYEAIQKPELTKDAPEFRIHITRNADARTLTIVDNGIGMSGKELSDHLGTIAHSGTAKLMEKVSKSKDKEEKLNLIGQFGVGFYASYMVADYVTVVSRKAGAKAVNTWESDGASGFITRKATKEEEALLDGERGTAIVLNLKDSASDFLLPEKIEQTIQTYSDHINVPIYMVQPNDRNAEDKPVNTVTALWMRPKNEITDEQYTEFYKHISHGFDEPLLTAHWHAEGVIDFRALLFIPTMRPFDLYEPNRKNAVRLYVRRVYISDSIDGLMYPWLRFVRGIIDSEDLPLNISRESLQHNPVITKIRSAVTRRILGDLDKLSRNDEAGFLTFWGQFGAALKEGLYDAPEHREAIFKICRFYSTHGEGEKLTSLEDYVERMKDGQDTIYYMSGENLDSLKNSPQIEGFKSRGIEVLFFTDTIDDFWLQQIHDFQGKKFQSVTRGNIDLDQFEENKDEDGKKDDSARHNDLTEKLKTLLAEEVEDVCISNRLTDSPVCLVAPETGVDMHMERVLKLHQKYMPTNKPVLEINAEHALIKKLEALDTQSEDFKQAGEMLLDQAKIIQGEPLQNPAEFARRMAEFMNRAL